MKSLFFKLFLLSYLLVMSSASLLAQYDWQQNESNPLTIHGTPGSWDESVLTPCVIFNSDLNRYEMWFGTFDGTYPNNGIGFAWSTDGIIWTKHPTAVMTPSGTGWEAVSVGECSVIKEGNTYKMWYTGHPNSTRTPSYIGYATSTDGGITWQKYAGNPVLNPGIGWESARVEFPSVIKLTEGYWMFYTGESAPGVARTGRAFSTDGINWQKDTVNNPVLLPGDPSEWDQNNYLGNVIDLNNTLYIYYTGETNPGGGGTAIGGASSSDLGVTWTKFANNPILTQGTSGQWNYGWIETGCAVFAQNELKLYYDGGGAATGWLGRIGVAVSDPLPAGTYTVGKGGSFTTIQDAFDKLDTAGVAGNVTLELIDELYTAPTTRYGFYLNGPIPGAGPNSRVTIKPAENKNVVIEGSNEGVFYLLNTSYMTFDGVDIKGSTTLTIHALQNLSYTFNDALDFMNDSDNDIIQNIIFIVERTNTASGSGFWFTEAGSAPDSNLIQHNFVKKAGDAFFITSASTNLRGKDNVIRGNQIGSETDSLISFGLEVSGCENSIIENNTVQNLKTTISGTGHVQTGILSTMSSGTIIRNNVLKNFRASSGYSTSGIFLGSDALSYGADNVVYNNMIYDIQSTSPQNDSRVTGIESWYQNNPKIYYNSVYLSGSGSQKSGSAALYIGGNNSNVEVKNNILANTRDEGQYWASAIFCQTSSISTLTSDFNDLIANHYLVRIGNTNYLTLEDWQATSRDLHSLSEVVNFVSPGDLHINTDYNTLLDGSATPIAGIVLDFDGEIRNTSFPDIGADEFEVSQNASNWQMQNSNFPADVMIINFSAVDNQTCWAVGQKIPPNSTPYAGFIKTTNGGTSWSIDTIPGITNGYLDEIFALDENTAYVTCYKLVGTTGIVGIYKTTDGGFTWIRQNAYNSSQTGPAYIYFFDAENGLVIGDYLETYTTTNGGEDWNTVTMPTPLTDEWTYLGENRFTVIGNIVWFCTNKGRVFKSTDKGYTWNIIFSESRYFDWMPSIAFQNEDVGIYALKQAGTETDHIYKKTVDGGTSWSTITNSVLDNLAPSGLQYIPGSVSTYVVTGGRASTMRGFGVSHDAGETWTLLDTLGNVYISFASDIRGWGSQFGSNMLYSYVGPRITNIQEEVIDLVPTGYSITQNYPNPFNPVTTIRYSIPTPSKVVIKIFDILGNEIAILMDKEKHVGTYELTWNAANLPSGVYFYRLTAGDFIATKKMVLLK